MMKKICVLIPYFEAGAALTNSLDSLDPIEDLHAVVVDDGSRIRLAADALKGWNGSVGVTLIELPENRGIEHALNAGLEHLVNEYEYIARLDCGDLCIRGRLRKQLSYMESHNECALVGSWVDFVTPSGEFLYTLRQPSDPKGIKRRMFVNCAFTHPSVVIRSSVVAELGGYPTDRPAAEDFALFSRIARVHEVSNINEPLVACLIDPGGISNVRRRVQLRSRIRILQENFEPSGIAVYGLVRAFVQLLTPRTVTVRLRRLRGRLMKS